MNTKAITLTLLTSIFIFAGCTNVMEPEKIQPIATPSPTPQISPIPSLMPSPTASAAATLSKNVSYTCIKGKTAFDSLFSTKHTAVFKTTSLGKLITQIDGIDQGNGKYWQYSIDGKEAQIGADAYTCKGGEVILWEVK